MMLLSARMLTALYVVVFLVSLREWVPVGYAEQPPQTTTSDNTPMSQQPRLIFEPAKTPILQVIQPFVMQDKVLKELVEETEAQSAPNVHVSVRVKECGEDDTRYSPKTQEITVCLESVLHDLNVFRGHIRSIKSEKARGNYARQYLRWQIHFTLWHEVAHALIHQLHLPVLGNEEDAADTLAAMFLLAKEENGPQAVLSVAEYFRLIGLREQVDWADKHAPHFQRSYNMLCLVYGHDPRKYKHIVGTKKGQLPKERAAHCESEYIRKLQGWVTLTKAANKPFAQTNHQQRVTPGTEAICTDSQGATLTAETLK